VNNFTKTPEQAEIAEIFERLEKEFKMTKADIARELNLGRGYIGYLVIGKRNPAPRTLEQFRELEARRKAARDHGQVTENTLGDLDHLYDRIAIMQKLDPPNFEVVKKVVESLAPTNPRAAAATSKLQKKVAEANVSSSNIQTTKGRVKAALQTLTPEQQAEARGLARNIRGSKT